MREAGAATLGQDEATSVVYGMPKVAFEIGAVERQIPLRAHRRAKSCAFAGRRVKERLPCQLRESLR